MVDISMFGSGEGPVWATGRGYSTSLDLAGLGLQGCTPKDDFRLPDTKRRDD